MSKRIITACSECHRRKQRCNRRAPCNICVARGAQDKCTYGGPKETPKSDVVRQLRPHHDPLSMTRTFEEQQEISQNSYEETLAGKIGYSLQKDKNAYQSLQKSFRIPDELLRLHDPMANATVSSPDPSLAPRYRNLVALIPPMAIAKALIETYFVEVSWYSMLVDRYYFEADFDSWQQTYNGAHLDRLSRDLQFFPALLFQVLAVSIQFLPPGDLTAKLLRVEDSASRERLSHRYSTAGMELMALLKRHNPTLTSVQHDQVRSLWLKCNSRGTESWYSLGDAVRQAQELSIHEQDEVPQGADVGETLSRLWFDEHKRRIWVALFIADSHMSIILGRPRLINTSDCTARTPFNCDIPANPSNTIPGTANLNGPPSHYSLSLFNYAIGHLYHEMLSFSANKKHTKNYGSVRTLHEKVDLLLSDLPPVVRPQNPDTSWDSRDPAIPRQRMQIVTTANSFIISLHREHVSVHAESKMAAVHAGLELLAAQEKMSTLLQRHHYRMYGISCHTIDACMFLSALILDKDTVVGLEYIMLQSIVDALRMAINQLKLMAYASPMAKSGAELLESCFPQVQEMINQLYGNVSSHSSNTLSVEHQDHTKGQSSQGLPELSDTGVDANVDRIPTGLDDFGGDRFRPDMFEEFVTFDDQIGGDPTFDFDLMASDASGLDFSSTAGFLDGDSQIAFQSG